mmetsp:Transcript_6990/g.26909  ORF Transcript_6990/g.26909 Transcript_6990/m.26909 type:complete len:382 (+) Transcript_6990:433-1578(+)
MHARPTSRRLFGLRKARAFSKPHRRKMVRSPARSLPNPITIRGRSVAMRDSEGGSRLVSSASSTLRTLGMPMAFLDAFCCGTSVSCGPRVFVVPSRKSGSRAPSGTACISARWFFPHQTAVSAALRPGSSSSSCTILRQLMICCFVYPIRLMRSPLEFCATVTSTVVLSMSNPSISFVTCIVLSLSRVSKTACRSAASSALSSSFFSAGSAASPVSSVEATSRRRRCKVITSSSPSADSFRVRNCGQRAIPAPPSSLFLTDRMAFTRVSLIMRARFTERSGAAGFATSSSPDASHSSSSLAKRRAHHASALALARLHHVDVASLGERSTRENALSPRQARRWAVRITWFSSCTARTRPHLPPPNGPIPAAPFPVSRARRTA